MVLSGFIKSDQPAVLCFIYGVSKSFLFTLKSVIGGLILEDITNFMVTSVMMLG